MGKRMYRFRLTKIMVLFAVLFFCLPMIVFSFFSYSVFQENIEKRVSEYSLLLTKQIETNLDLKLGEYKDLIIQIIRDPDIVKEIKILKREKADVVGNPRLSTQIVQYISVAPEFKSIAFLSREQYIKSIFVWNDMSLREEVYDATVEGKNLFQWFGQRDQTYRDSFGEHSESVFSMSKGVWDFTSGENLDTVIVIDVSASSLADICNKIIAKDLPLSWCIVDAQGKLQFSSGNFLDINENVVDREQPLMAALAVILAAMMAGIFIMIKKVIYPINNLAKVMKGPVGEHQLDYPQEISSPIEEISVLYHSYNTMMQEIDRLIQEVYEKGEQKRIVQIKALESQINPHFLYNTLDTIKWTALIQEGKNAAEMASMLSKLLHISLSGGNEMIPLKNEVEHVKAYVGIQKYRMDIEFHVVYMIEEGTEDLLVPKILFQPFVENSIIHGFKKGTKGMIEVLAFLSDDALILQVNDNGVGIEEQKMSSLKTNRDKGKRFSNIGIYNVRERIRLICGPGYGVKINSKVGYGTNVEMKLPVRRQEEDVQIC